MLIPENYEERKNETNEANKLPAFFKSDEFKAIKTDLKRWYNDCEIFEENDFTDFFNSVSFFIKKIEKEYDLTPGIFIKCSHCGKEVKKVEKIDDKHYCYVCIERINHKFVDDYLANSKEEQ